MGKDAHKGELGVYNWVSVAPIKHLGEFQMDNELVLPPVIKTVHTMRYVDINGFSRTLKGDSRTELEQVLEALVLDRKATLVGAVFSFNTITN